MGFRFTQYLDMLFMAPLLIVAAGSIIFFVSWIGFSLYDFLKGDPIMTEYLVTAQGYNINDQYKQTILLHDAYIAEDEDHARREFIHNMSKDYHIMKIYSITNLS